MTKETGQSLFPPIHVGGHRLPSLYRLIILAESGLFFSLFLPAPFTEPNIPRGFGGVKPPPYVNNLREARLIAIA